MHSAALASEYRSLQKSNPAKCGEWLKSLQTQYKLNQTQLAAKLNTNRQVIGRYLKTVKGKKKVKCHSVSRKDHATAGSAVSTEPSVPAPSLTWIGLFKTLTTPQTFFCLLAITGLTSYLIQQGMIFFAHVESTQNSLVSNAILAEAISLISAAFFAISIRKSHKFLLGIILTGSIIGMGCFMHASIGQQMITQSTISKQTQLEQKILNSSLTALSQSLNSLPANYVSKRQELIRQLDFQRAELNKLDLKPGSISLTTSATFTFSVWLRVAAMLLNALLVHGVVGRAIALKLAGKDFL